MFLNGPSDVGGECPDSTNKYGSYCCCSNGCCWKRCVLSSPPINCLPQIPNSQWKYSQELGYYQAVIANDGILNASIRYLHIFSKPMLYF